MNTIAPQDMRQRLMLNQAPLNCAEDVAQEIEDYWGATEEFSRDDTGQAGFIAPVGKGPEKQEKGGTKVEKAWTKVRCTKDSDSNPSVVSGDVLQNTAIRVGEMATKKRSVGLNKSTQRAIPIHHKTRCKETFVNGQIQRRKGKVTTSPKEKEREKAKAKEKSHEKRTTTRSRLDLRTRKLDSAS